MRGNRSSEARIVAVLKESAAGIRKTDVTDAPIIRGGLATNSGSGPFRDPKSFSFTHPAVLDIVLPNSKSIPYPLPPEKSNCGNRGRYHDG